MAEDVGKAMERQTFINDRKVQRWWRGLWTFEVACDKLKLNESNSKQIEFDFGCVR